MMPKPPPKQLEQEPRPGVWGAVLDRRDLIVTAFRSYVRQVEERKNQLNRSVDDTSGDVMYESRRKGPADTSAKNAGKIEKLK